VLWRTNWLDEGYLPLHGQNGQTFGGGVLLSGALSGCAVFCAGSSAGGVSTASAFFGFGARCPEEKILNDMGLPFIRKQIFVPMHKWLFKKIIQ
jgi:hypothetical protein